MTGLTKQMKEMERIVNPLRGLAMQLHSHGHMQTIQDSLSQHQFILASTFNTLNTQSAISKLFDQTSVHSSALRKATEQISAAATRIASSLESTMLPNMSALSSIAEQLSNMIPTIYSPDLSWAKTLQSQMEAIHTPWVLTEFPALSFEGFASISRLNSVLRQAEPFSGQTHEFVDADLGDPINVKENDSPEARDVAHIEAGMNARLLAFPPSALEDVLIQAGFVFKAEFALIPAKVDDSDLGLIFHPGNNNLITFVEQKLRKEISERMADKYGEEWLKKRINKNLVADWETKRQATVAGGERPLPLIQYSNFMELKDIIIGGDHWNLVFKQVFVRKEHFVTSMERLYPIRNSLAHSRPIGQGQQIHLISEAARILRAFEIDIFKS